MAFRINSYEEYLSEYKRSIEEPEAFWEGIADHYLWCKRWDTTLDWEFKTPSVEWFKGGKLSIPENCPDRHLEAPSEKSAQSIMYKAARGNVSHTADASTLLDPDVVEEIKMGALTS